MDNTTTTGNLFPLPLPGQRTTEAQALENLLREGCPFHPDYKAIYPPKADCGLCEKIYNAKQGRTPKIDESGSPAK